MTTSQEDIVFKSIIIAILFILLNIIRVQFKPLVPRPNATLLRKLMRDRMKSKRGAPHLCDKHTKSTLRPGQMAVIDNNHCELCEKERKAS